MKALVALALVAACTPPRGAPPGSPRPGTVPTALPPLARPIGTAVLDLESGRPTMVLQGPWLMTSINPGGALELAISASHCSDELAWFEYTGGGVGVGAGQTLCVRKYGVGNSVQAFGGYEPLTAAPAATVPAAQ